MSDPAKTTVTGGEALVAALAAHGVDVVFGIPGTHNLPIYAHLRDLGRVTYVSVTDEETLEAFGLLSRLECIIPALESSHAVAHALKLAQDLGPDKVIIVNLSGRGDKDVSSIQKLLEGR